MNLFDGIAKSWDNKPLIEGLSMQQHDQQKRNRKRMNPIEELKEPMIPHIGHREDQNDDKQH